MAIPLKKMTPTLFDLIMQNDKKKLSLAYVYFLTFTSHFFLSENLLVNKYIFFFVLFVEIPRPHTSRILKVLINHSLEKH